MPVGTNPEPGIKPDGPVRGGDQINRFEFLDANTFSILALAASVDYRNRIDWRRPMRFVIDNFAVTVTALGRQFGGYSLVKTPDSGVPGVAWEFTGQVVVAMRLLDRLYEQTEFAQKITDTLAELRQARLNAPFTDQRGLPAATLQDGDGLPPLQQCLDTPFQCIPERVGLVATAWAIFAEQDFNPLGDLPALHISVSALNFGSVAAGSCLDRILTIKNDGGTPLVGTVTGSGPFTVSCNGSFRLQPGETRSVVLRFCPNADVAGANSSITSNDRSASVALTGQRAERDPLTPRVSLIRAGHFTDLRESIDALRVCQGMARFAHSSIVPEVTGVRASDLQNLRTALNDVHIGHASVRLRRRVVEPTWDRGETPGLHLGEGRTVRRRLLHPGDEVGQVATEEREVALRLGLAVTGDDVGEALQRVRVCPHSSG